MITVQIASQLTAQGVDGVRWVLIEETDGAAAVPPPAETLLAAAPAGRSAAWLLGLKALVILAGLGAAVGLARLEFGAPVLGRQAPKAQPAPAPINPAPPTTPPAAPASQPALVAGAGQP